MKRQVEGQIESKTRRPSPPRKIFAGEPAGDYSLIAALLMLV